MNSSILIHVSNFNTILMEYGYKKSRYSQNLIINLSNYDMTAEFDYFLNC